MQPVFLGINNVTFRNHNLTEINMLFLSLGRDIFLGVWNRTCTCSNAVSVINLPQIPITVLVSTWDTMYRSYVGICIVHLTPACPPTPTTRPLVTLPPHPFTNTLHPPTPATPPAPGNLAPFRGSLRGRFDGGKRPEVTKWRHGVRGCREMWPRRPQYTV